MYVVHSAQGLATGLLLFDFPLIDLIQFTLLNELRFLELIVSYFPTSQLHAVSTDHRFVAHVSCCNCPLFDP